MNREISIVHTIASLHPAGGGPSQTVAQFTDALAAIQGLTVTLLYQSKSGDPSVGAANPAVIRRELCSSSTLSLKLGIPMRAVLAEYKQSARPDIIHDNGLWMPVNHWSAGAARRLNIPHVIQTHGMLSPWAIAHKGFKKRLALAVYQHRDLKEARVLIATANAEYENLRTFGLRQPIAVIPNGIQMLAPGGNVTRERQADAPRKVLFLGRIYPVKGLLNLVDAWAQIRPTGWRLQIAGPDEDGHLAQVLARIQRAGIQDTVTYVGEVGGAAKTSLFQTADLFVLPSHSENFGVVVAEALAYGVPVITTRGAPWADLDTYGCGWWIDIGVEPLVAALRGAMALNDEDRLAMGERGRAYVQRYDWGCIARQTADVYRWVLGHGPKPDCVRLD